MFRLHLLLLLTVIFIGIRYGGVAFGLLDVLTITIPATVIGVTVAATWSLKRGKDLDKNPEFQERLRDP